MLSVESLSKSFGKRQVLKSISFSLQPGKVYGLIGINGAGKSTLMKILAGLEKPTSGKVLLDGEPLEGNEKANIGYMIESPVFFGHMSGEENLLLLAELQEGIGKKEVEEALATAGLSNRAKDEYHAYSLGMKQRLYFAFALMGNPNILLLDEPFSGVDPITTKIFEDAVRKKAEEGAYILISSHDIREIQALADGALILSEGKLPFFSEEVGGTDLFSTFLDIEKGGSLL